MESDQRSSFLFGRIFCDEPVSTPSENTLDGQDQVPCMEVDCFIKGGLELHAPKLQKLEPNEALCAS